MWKAAKWGMLALAVAITIVLAGVVGHTLGQGEGGIAAPTQDGAPIQEGDFRILDEIYRILQEDFIDAEDIDPEILRLGAINGILQALGDPHTIYIDPETYSLGIDVISGTFQGIGAQVEQDPLTGDIVIVTPFRDSPAEKAGVRAGDVILAVDGESTEGWTVSQAVRRIRGSEGTEVTLTVQHADGEIEDLVIVRETIIIPTVRTNVGDEPDVEIEDANGDPVEDLAYVELQQVTEQTLPDLTEVLKDIKEQGYRGLILDLRRNPGGALSATIDVADMFLDEGTILIQVDREGNETTFPARPGGAGTDIPMVVLVGPGSASGAEVIIAALRDNGRAVLIGESTFGKGAVNHLRVLSDGGALYVTIGRWLTPNGEQIEGIGVAPDIRVEFTDEDIELRRDVQLFAAIDYLRENLTQGR